MGSGYVLISTLQVLIRAKRVPYELLIWYVETLIRESGCSYKNLFTLFDPTDGDADYVEIFPLFVCRMKAYVHILSDLYIRFRSYVHN